MLDAALRRVIDPPLAGAARPLVRMGIGADTVTMAGFGPVSYTHLTLPTNSRV